MVICVIFLLGWASKNVPWGGGGGCNALEVCETCALEHILTCALTHSHVHLHTHIFCAINIGQTCQPVISSIKTILEKKIIKNSIF